MSNALEVHRVQEAVQQFLKSARDRSPSVGQGGEPVALFRSPSPRSSPPLLRTVRISPDEAAHRSVSEPFDSTESQLYYPPPPALPPSTSTRPTAYLTPYRAHDPQKSLHWLSSDLSQLTAVQREALADRLEVEYLPQSPAAPTAPQWRQSPPLRSSSTASTAAKGLTVRPTVDAALLQIQPRSRSVRRVAGDDHHLVELLQQLALREIRMRVSMEQSELQDRIGLMTTERVSRRACGSSVSLRPSATYPRSSWSSYSGTPSSFAQPVAATTRPPESTTKEFSPNRVFV